MHWIQLILFISNCFFLFSNFPFAINLIFPLDAARGIMSMRQLFKKNLETEIPDITHPRIAYVIRSECMTHGLFCYASCCSLFFLLFYFISLSNRTKACILYENLCRELGEFCVKKCGFDEHLSGKSCVYLWKINVRIRDALIRIYFMCVDSWRRLQIFAFFCYF